MKTNKRQPRLLQAIISGYGDPVPYDIVGNADPEKIAQLADPMKQGRGGESSSFGGQGLLLISMGAVLKIMLSRRSHRTAMGERTTATIVTARYNDYCSVRRKCNIQSRESPIQIP